MTENGLDVEDSDDEMEYHECETKVVTLKTNIQKTAILKREKREF